jgi:hypothetical protein
MNLVFSVNFTGDNTGMLLYWMMHVEDTLDFSQLSKLVDLTPYSSLITRKGVKIRIAINYRSRLRWNN